MKCILVQSHGTVSLFFVELKCSNTKSGKPVLLWNLFFACLQVMPGCSPRCVFEQLRVILASGSTVMGFAYWHCSWQTKFIICTVVGKRNLLLSYLGIIDRFFYFSHFLFPKCNKNNLLEYVCCFSFSRYSQKCVTQIYWALYGEAMFVSFGGAHTWRP